MRSINEQSTGVLTITFLNEDKEPVIPASVKYSIIDVTSNTPVKALTEITPVPTNSSYDLVIPHTLNNIINPLNESEERAVSVIFTHAGGKQATGEYRYEVCNLLAI